MRYDDPIAAASQDYSMRFVPVVWLSIVIYVAVDASHSQMHRRLVPPSFLQASILRRVFEQRVIEALEKAGLQWRFGDFRALPGAELIPHTIAKLDHLLQELGV
jgi:hypothetical protein